MKVVSSLLATRVHVAGGEGGGGIKRRETRNREVAYRYTTLKIGVCSAYFSNLQART